VGYEGALVGRVFGRERGHTIGVRVQLLRDENGEVIISHIAQEDRACHRSPQA